jgi:PAS domain S-box-containing protein
MGKIVKWVGLNLDITERKRAEEDIEYSEVRFRELFNNMSSGVGVYEARDDGNDFIIKDYNRAGEMISKVNRENIVGRSVLEVFPGIKKFGLFEVFQRAWKTGEPGNHPVSLYEDNYLSHWAENYVYKLPSGEIVAVFDDVTERKQAEEALRQAEDNFRRSLDDSPLGVRIVTMGGETIYANRAILDMYGYDSIEELRTTPVKKRYTPESYAEFRIRKKKRRRGEYAPLEYEISIVKKNGEVRHLQVFRKEILWNGERQFQTIYLDITKNKHMEDALRESEEQYRTLVEAAPDVVYTISGEDGSISSLNSAFESITGWSRDEWIGKSFIEIVHPDDRALAIEIFEKCCRREMSLVYELRILSKSGEYLIGEFTSTPYLKGGEAIGEFGIARDITKRKQAEDALRESQAHFSNIFHFSPVSITISTVKDGQLIDVNDAWQRLTGFSREEAIGRTAISLNLWVNPGDRNRLLSRLSKEGMVENFEIQVRHKSGRVMDLLMFARSINIVSEQYMLLLAQDITEQKRLESETQQRQKMESLGTLVAGVAHEINNPINTIMNNAPLLQGVWKDLLSLVEECAEKEPGRRYGGLYFGFLKENLDQLISDMDIAANRVAAIVKGLKDFSRKTSSMEKQKVNINIAVENAIRLAGSTVKKSGITLALGLTPNLPSINANLQNLEQIILNLLINAVQAIEHNYGEIRITTSYNKHQGAVVLSVQDNGKGIPSAIYDKIFDPFFTEWQSIGGTGLGLPITQNLVKANDGEISFKSRPGKGTSFFVTFSVGLKKRPFKILVVDDEEAVLEIIKKALSIERNYEVETAHDGNEALIKIGAYHPDLLLLDIFMPKMDGVEVCRAIKKHAEFKDMKVIIFTGYPEHEKVNKVAEMGFIKVVSKPFQLEEFLKEVEKMLSTNA